MSADLPVSDSSDVLAVLPDFLRPDDAAPVRDGLIAALTQIMLTWQDRAAYAAAEADVLRATGSRLAEIGSEVGASPQAGESDSAYRARILTTPDIVTPSAILAGAAAVLAPYTSVLPQYYESIDRWFVSAGDASWHSYVYASPDVPRSPDYYDRLYLENVATNGVYRTHAEPGCVRAFTDSIGRVFHLRVPDLSPLGSDVAGAFIAPGSPVGLFVGDGTSSNNTSFVRVISATALSVYTALANVIDRIKGHSIRWELIVDPNLT